MQESNEKGFLSYVIHCVSREVFIYLFYGATREIYIVNIVFWIFNIKQELDLYKRHGEKKKRREERKKIDSQSRLTKSSDC